MMSDDPPRFNENLRDVIYNIDPREVQSMSDIAHIGARKILDELAASDPEFAKEQRRHKREMKAWRRERNKLCSEVTRLQAPFIMLLLDIEQDGTSALAIARAMIRTSDYLFENDAPAELIRDLLLVGQQMLPTLSSGES